MMTLAILVIQKEAHLGLPLFQEQPTRLSLFIIVEEVAE
jgi:hypothetical protein